MNIYQLPPDIKNAVLQGAMRVLSECDTMRDLVNEVNTLLAADYHHNEPKPTTVAEAEEQLALAKWTAEFRETMIDFWAKTGYPNKHWNSTLKAEMSTWIPDEWKTSSGKAAALSNISYWES